MFASPFQKPMPATHTGVRDGGRRVELVCVDGSYLTRTEAKARLSGFTREEGTYTDVRVLTVVGVAHV